MISEIFLISNVQAHAHFSIDHHPHIGPAPHHLHIGYLKSNG